MTDAHKLYYHEMIRRNRAVVIKINDRMAALITFFITDKDNDYEGLDPWEIVDDNSQGKVCYIAQMLTDKDKDNYNMSFKALNIFIEQIKSLFPSVKRIFWRRWHRKTNIVKCYKKEL